MRDFIYQFLVKLGLIREKNLYYIGGSDILPPPLKGEQEQVALEALESGNEEAKQQLIEHNLRLVVFIARRFENTGINLEDLISIGTIGLIKPSAAKIIKTGFTNTLSAIASNILPKSVTKLYFLAK